METAFLMINLVTYGLLFGTFVIKFTDLKERDILRKSSYLLLMLWTLFMAIILFKIVFVYGFVKGYFLLNPYQTITNVLFLVFMWSKARHDDLFKKKI